MNQLVSSSEKGSRQPPTGVDTPSLPVHAAVHAPSTVRKPRPTGHHKTRFQYQLSERNTRPIGFEGLVVPQESSTLPGDSSTSRSEVFKNLKCHTAYLDDVIVFDSDHNPDAHMPQHQGSFQRWYGYTLSSSSPRRLESAAKYGTRISSSPPFLQLAPYRTRTKRTS